jgi:hypothetical protein
MRLRWSQIFGGFENINWKKELKIKIQNITKGRERQLDKDNYIVMVLVIIDGVCIRNRIYWTLITRNYK